MQTSAQVEHLLAIEDEVGESPIWSVREQVLYWVDIEGQRGHRFQPNTMTKTTYDFDIPVTAIAPRRSGGWITPTKEGIYLWEADFQNPRFVNDPVAHVPHVRFNDGVVDRQGRFWSGTLNDLELEALDGTLYCLTADKQIRAMATGFAVANGITWSPDGTILYIANMFQGIVEAFDQDRASGQLSNRRLFVRVPPTQGLPDGLTMDTEGFLWVAHWGGGCITRYDPLGVLERTISFPVTNITRCTFGGSDLDELYVTSAWYGLDAKDHKRQSKAGDLFRVSVGIKGLEEEEFIEL